MCSLLGGPFGQLDEDQLSLMCQNRQVQCPEQQSHAGTRLGASSSCIQHPKVCPGHSPAAVAQPETRKCPCGGPCSPCTPLYWLPSRTPGRSLLFAASLPSLTCQLLIVSSPRGAPRQGVGAIGAVLGAVSSHPNTTGHTDLRPLLSLLSLRDN